VSRERVERELLAWMRDEPEREDEARFERLALELFRWQLAHCAPYRRFCEGRGIATDPGAGGAGREAGGPGWRALPPVPTGAFKELALRSFPAHATVKTFRTSGTAAERHGELHLDTLALYEASLLPSFEAGLLPDVEGALPILVLAPSAGEAPDSSLSHMFAVMLERRGAEGSGCFVQGGALQTDALIERLDGFDEGPLLVCGTAFAFVHLMEALAARGRSLVLPAGARLMETGGFKGQARERSREALYAELGDALGVAPERIVNQYGMTELGSQFYDTVLRDPGGPRRKRVPPWVRVRLLDPLSGVEVEPGEPGLVTVVDLANTGSVLALQTADLGRAVGDGFEVLGRSPGAEARGCSIAVDAMLRTGGSDE
jgi:hypothetical protein